MSTIKTVENKGQITLGDTLDGLSAFYQGNELPIHFYEYTVDGTLHINYYGYGEYVRYSNVSATAFEWHAEPLNGYGVLVYTSESAWPEQFSEGQPPPGEPSYYSAYRFDLSTGRINGIYVTNSERKIGVEQDNPSLPGSGLSQASWGSPTDIYGTGDYRDAKVFFDSIINPAEGHGIINPDNTNTSTTTTSAVNTFFNQIIDNVIDTTQTPNPTYSQPSFQTKIYNLGEDRYAVATDDGIDEITGAVSVQFADQSLDLTLDIKATFDQVTGMDEVNGVIFRLYNAAFARLPDAGGLSNWINANSDGSFSYEQTANEFVNSQESINRYGSNQGDTDYITTVYNNVLDRDPDSAGLSHYESLLGSGEMSRAEMMFAFSESPENRILFTEVTGIS